MTQPKDNGEKKLRSGLAALDVEVSDEHIERLFAFLDILLQKNKKLNLTAIRNREDAIEKHLIDSLVLIPVIERLPATTDSTANLLQKVPAEVARGTLMDIGTGGGLPGIPIKCVYPDMKVSLVEAKAKKVRFLKETIQKMGLKHIKAYHHFLDPECPVDFLGRYDWIVSRASLSITELVRNAILYKKEFGAIILMKGPKVDEELEEAMPQIQRLSLMVDQRIEFELPFSKAKRTIVVLR